MRAAAAATVEGTVVELLPRGLYRVAVDGRDLTAHAPSGLSRNFVRLVVGDRVVLEMSARDGTRGRIVKKVRTSNLS